MMSDRDDELREIAGLGDFAEHSADLVFKQAQQINLAPVCVMVVVAARDGVSFRMSIAEAAFAGQPVPEGFDPGNLVMKLVNSQLAMLPGLGNTRPARGTVS